MPAQLQLSRYPLINSLMLEMHGAGRGNPWRLLADLFDTHPEQLDRDRWYTLADFMSRTLWINGFQPTAAEHARFVRERGGSLPWGRLLSARERDFGTTTTDKFPLFSKHDHTAYNWLHLDYRIVKQRKRLRTPPRSPPRSPPPHSPLPWHSRRRASAAGAPPSVR